MRPPAAEHFQKLYQEKLSALGRDSKNPRGSSPERHTRSLPEMAPTSQRGVRSSRGMSDDHRHFGHPALPGAPGLGEKREESRRQLGDEVSQLRDLIAQQQSALVRQQDALGQATEALALMRQDRAQTLENVKKEAAKVVEEATSAARTAAMEEAQKRLHEERKGIEAMVKDGIAHERQKHHSRMGQVSSTNEEDHLALLNDPAIRAKLLERAAQEGYTVGGEKPNVALPLLQVPPLFQDEFSSRRPSGRGPAKISRGSSREKIYAKRPRSKESKVPRANMRTCGRCKQLFVLQENNSKACRTHPGRFVAAKKKPTRLADIGAQVMGRGDPSSKYRADDEGTGKWSCCGATDMNAPGCHFTHHEPGDKMKF
jgi:hypothetical protein